MHVKLTVRKFKECCCICIMTYPMTVNVKRMGYTETEGILLNHRGQRGLRGKGI